jgi:hypothetical protein
VAAGDEVVGAVAGRVKVEDAIVGVPQAMNGPLGRLSQVRLQLGGGLLDRVEVGAVGREEEEGCVDGGAHGGVLCSTDCP